MFDFFDNYNCLKNKNLSFIVIQKNIFLPVYVFLSKIATFAPRKQNN